MNNKIDIVNNWHSESVKDTEKKLNTNVKVGLSFDEVKSRLNKNGYNVIPKAKKDTFLKIFLLQLKDPIIYILLVSMLLSFIVNELIDGIFIFVVIMLDAILGAIQEWKSSKSAEALQNLIKVEATVLRNNKKEVINASELVVGDIVYLESGTRVPADLRLVDTKNLSIDEAILTGESISTNKNTIVLPSEIILNDRINMAFVGTAVMKGRGIGIVVSTGVDTEMGKIAHEVLNTKDSPSPLSIRMEKFTKQISVIIAIFAVVLSILLYYKGYVPREIFFAVIALSISAIPEGLPVVLTLSLSIASNKMSKKHVLVKKLNAVESLGSATVIASDKTGTLTLNEQTAKVILLPDNTSINVDGNGYNGNGKVRILNENIKELIKIGVINNESYLEKINSEWVSYGDGVDIAFAALGYKANIIKKDYSKDIIGLIPYESEQKYSASFFKEDKIYCGVKGSLETIVKFADKMKVGDKVVKIDKELLYKQNNDLSSKGYRVIAIALGVKKSFVESNNYNETDIPKLTILGLVGFIDPIRKDVINAIKKCTTAGIKTVMITGDHPLTAYSIAKELGMVSNENEITNGEEIDKYLILGHNDFDDFVKSKKVFSRVNPIQKFEIVESYKRQGEFVAVTGDGVNDAPALKAANVGVAMGSGTDVAKETAQVILTDDNFSSIVNGVEEGRGVYSNVRKVIYMLLSCGVCEITFFLLSIICGYEMPLVAVQLLWLNLVTDGIQDTALAFEKNEKGLMNKRPRKPNESIFDQLLINETLLIGVVMGAIVFGLWIYLLDVKKMDIVFARSCVLLLMVFLQNLHVINCRSEITSIFKIPFKNNWYVVIGILSVLLLQFVVVENSFLSNVLDTTVIPISQVFEIFLFALPILLVSELFKYFERSRQKRLKL